MKLLHRAILIWDRVQQAMRENAPRNECHPATYYVLTPAERRMLREKISLRSAI